MDQHHRANLSCRFQKYSLEVADVLDQLLQALPKTWMKTWSNPAFSVSALKLCNDRPWPLCCLFESRVFLSLPFILFLLFY